jgi:hypothetical protein
MIFTPMQAASVAGLSLQTIMRHIKKKQLKASRTRGYEIEASDLRDYLTSRLVMGEV